MSKMWRCHKWWEGPAEIPKKKKPIYKRVWFWLGLAAVVGIGATMCGSGRRKEAMIWTG